MMLPLTHFIEEIYLKHSAKIAPDAVMSIEERVRLQQEKKQAKKEGNDKRATETQ
jgi:hypothetical protein